MKQRRIYTPPQATLLDCEGPELLGNSNIYFASPTHLGNGASSYDAATDYGDNIADWQTGDDIDFDFEE